jgi:hypothetical protein
LAAAALDADVTDDLPGLGAALADLEASHDCTVLAARDTGSRAWNLAGPDSDHDVAVVFAQPAVRYAQLDRVVEHVEVQVRADLELSGWNVRRFGELLVQSNPAALEFLHSPLRHREHAALAALERDVADRFDPLAAYHHYRSLATRQYRKYLQHRLLDDGEAVYVVVDDLDDEYVVRPHDAPDAPTERVAVGAYEETTTDPTVGRALYVVRGALYARYVLETGQFPTLDLPAFLSGERDRFDASAVECAEALVERKRAGAGDAPIARETVERLAALLDLPEHVDPGRYGERGIPRDRVNAFIAAVLS